MPRRLDVDDEILGLYFAEARPSASMVALAVGCSRGTVANRLHERGVMLRNRPGPAIPPAIRERIRFEAGCGRSSGEIAAMLNDEGVATAYGGVRRWWATTVRHMLQRAAG
jgi:hypothetical protein